MIRRKCLQTVVGRLQMRTRCSNTPPIQEMAGTSRRRTAAACRLAVGSGCSGHHELGMGGRRTVATSLASRSLGLPIRE